MNVCWVWDCAIVTSWPIKAIEAKGVGGGCLMVDQNSNSSLIIILLSVLHDLQQELLRIASRSLDVLKGSYCTVLYCTIL